MDGRRFDALTRAVTERGSRRRLLTRLLAGTGLAAGFGSGRFVAPAAAQQDDRKCRNKPAIDNNRCPQDEAICRLRDNQICSCARTVGGAKRCVDLTDEECPTEDECDSNDDCRGGQLCIQVGGCCEGRRRNLCVRPCGSSTTTGASTSGGSPVRAPLLGRP